MNERDWILLNLYADGEMQPADAQAFADRLSRDQALSGALEEILGAKRAIAKMFAQDSAASNASETNASTHRPHMAATNPAPSRWRHVLPLAAGIALAAVIAGGVHFMESAEPGWPNRAASIHAAMSERGYEIERNHIAVSAPIWRSSSIVIPDLGFSALYFAGLETTRDHLALHYRGLNGCSLTITVLEGAEAAGSEAEVLIHDEQIFRMWQEDGYRYVVVSDGMDSERFQAAARFIQSELRHKEEERESLRLAMRDAYNGAIPCA